MCSQETKLRKTESLRSPERLVLALRYYLAVLPTGKFISVPEPRRAKTRRLNLRWKVYLWAARRILQLRVKRGSGNELWYCLPDNCIQNLYVRTGLDLGDPIVAMRFRSIPPFFRMSSRHLEAFLAQYPNWFERLRNMLIEQYRPRPYERKRTC
jgi:hypothetical protein